MTIKSDLWLRKMAEEHQMISPFLPGCPRSEREPHHLSRRVELRLRHASGRRWLSDLLVGSCREIDPKRFDDHSSLIEPEAAHRRRRRAVLPVAAAPLRPRRHGRNFQNAAQCDRHRAGKSHYARAGLLVNTTPLEAGWTGRLVVEIANLANLPLRVYINEGIGQILFFESDEDCAVL